MSLHAAVAGYIDTLSAGHFDVPRRRVADDLRALLTEHPAAPAAGTPGVAATEYAVLSLRDGLSPVDSLEEALEQMTVLWPKPGRARIIHRLAWATEWTPLAPDAAGPALTAA